MTVIVAMGALFLGAFLGSVARDDARQSRGEPPAKRVSYVDDKTPGMGLEE